MSERKINISNGNNKKTEIDIMPKQKIKPIKRAKKMNSLIFCISALSWLFFISISIILLTKIERKKRKSIKKINSNTTEKTIKIIPYNNNYNSNTLPKIALCYPAKQENKYIRENVEYYKKLGMTKIYLYDTNDKEYEKVDTRIQDYIDEGFVEIHYLSGKYSNNLYNKDCFNKHQNEFDWICFFDVDEFLYINSNESFPEYISKKKFDKCDQVLFNWLVYDDNDEIKYLNRSLFERFQRPTAKKHKINQLVKSLVRTTVISDRFEAHISVNTKKTCNSRGNYLTKSNIIRIYRIKRLDFNYAFLKHFLFKSCEEYIEKLKRFNWFRKYDYNRPLSYFTINRVTQKKIEYFEKEFEVKLNKLKPYIGKVLSKNDIKKIIKKIQRGK